MQSKKNLVGWTVQIDLSCFFNHEKAPQFFNNAVDGSASELISCGKKCYSYSCLSAMSVIKVLKFEESYLNRLYFDLIYYYVHFNQ